MKALLVISLAALSAFASPSVSYGTGGNPKLADARQGEAKARYKTPVIPYPYQARRSHIIGGGIVQVSFDAQGRAIKAAMVKSTGSSVLDDTTTKYAKATWQSSPGKPSTIRVPVVFR